MRSKAPWGVQMRPAVSGSWKSEKTVGFISIFDACTFTPPKVTKKPCFPQGPQPFWLKIMLRTLEVLKKKKSYDTSSVLSIIFSQSGCGPSGRGPFFDEKGRWQERSRCTKWAPPRSCTKKNEKTIGFISKIEFSHFINEKWPKKVSPTGEKG